MVYSLSGGNAIPLAIRIRYQVLGVTICLFLAGCGAWVPAKSASIHEVFPSQRFGNLSSEAPQGSFRERLFEASRDRVYEAVLKSADRADLTIEMKNRPQGIVLATQTHHLNPPPGLLNCPNNHFANDKKLPWNYYIAIMIMEKSSTATRVKAMAKAQGSCFKGGGCMGHDPCPEYAAVHWAVGYDSADKELAGLMALIEKHLGQAP